MPNCISFTRKGGTEPVSFATMDKEICESLGIPPDPKYYHLGWYYLIACLMACGRSHDEIDSIIIRDSGGNPELCGEMKKINNFVREHFDSRAWYETKQ
jgi:hypothetical protein